MDITKRLPTLLKHHFAHPIIVLPFYGEFGYFVQSYIRLVHHLKASQKIVCIRPGEELFFPSATGFFYQWHDLFSDEEKCGFRNVWPIEKNYQSTDQERKLRQKVSTLFPNAEIIDITEPLPLFATPYFSVPLLPTPSLSKDVDVVICARRRAKGGHGHDIRNFGHWEKIVAPLVNAGYSIGLIGKAATSCDLPNVAMRSWDYRNNTATIIAILRQAKLYIGTDTGPTQIAALTKTPMVLFRHYSPGNPNLLHTIILPLAQQQGFPVHIVEEGWQRPELVAAAALAYLKEPSVAVQRSYAILARQQ